MSITQPIQILYEDAQLIVVNKPAGLSTESGLAAHPSVEKQLYSQLTQRDGKALHYLRAIHRLDRPVSGILMLAKQKAVLIQYMAYFEQKRVTKTYLAIVDGMMEQENYTFTHKLTRDASGRKALAFSVDEALDAPTGTSHVRVLAHVRNTTRVEVRPIEGRFHQIRVQLAAAGHPIVGDTMYGGSQHTQEHVILLHCSKLQLPDLEFQCDPEW